MIIQSRIRQSFQRTGGFVLERGRNDLIDPLSLRARRIIDALVQAKLVKILDEPAASVAAPVEVSEGAEPAGEPYDSVAAPIRHDHPALAIGAGAVGGGGGAAPGPALVWATGAGGGGASLVSPSPPKKRASRKRARK